MTKRHKTTIRREPFCWSGDCVFAVVTVHVFKCLAAFLSASCTFILRSLGAFATFNFKKLFNCDYYGVLGGA